MDTRFARCASRSHGRFTVRVNAFGKLDNELTASVIRRVLGSWEVGFDLKFFADVWVP